MWETYGFEQRFAFMKQVRINGCADCRGGSAFDSQCSALHTIVAPSEEFPTIQALEKKTDGEITWQISVSLAATFELLYH